MASKLYCKSKTLMFRDSTKFHKHSLRLYDRNRASTCHVNNVSDGVGALSLVKSKRQRPIAIKAVLDTGALSAVSGTTFKLVLLCALITRLMKLKILPRDTPVVLSKVAFNVFMPCLLCSKVALTLSKIKSPSMLGVPLMAFAQIATGLFFSNLLYSLYMKLSDRKTAVLLPDLAIAGGSGTTAKVDQLAAKDVGVEKSIDAKSETLKNIVRVSSGFGNSVTLPLIFFTSLLPAAPLYDRAAGYTALYLIGWSPTLWSLGYRLFVHTKEQKVIVEEEKFGAERIKAFVVDFAKSVKAFINPPMIGVLCGMIIGLTPLMNIFFPSKELLASCNTVTKFFLGIPKGMMELVQLLATALLANSTMVLSSSLIPVDQSKGEDVNVKDLLLPSSRDEFAALSIVILMRFVIMPLASIGLLATFKALGWLPIDPLCYLVLFVQGVMPPAQNTVLLLQLQASTRPLAPTMAKLLLRVYLLAVLPLSLWIGALVPRLELSL